MTRLGKLQWYLSYAGPLLLALAFALQFIARVAEAAIDDVRPSRHQQAISKLL